MLVGFLEKERMQLPCWIPVFIAVGILIGLKLQTINYLLLIPTIFIFLTIRFYSLQLWLRLILTSISCILIGLLAIQIRMKIIDAPIINFDEKFVWLKARIDNITPLEHGYKLLLSNVDIKKIPKKEAPKKIRLTVRTSLNNAKIGDYVRLNAILSKPMQPYLEDSYDFARDAYFKQIGAVGYSVSAFTVIKEDRASFIGKLNYLRNNIQTRVNDAIGIYYGSIATALMLNEYSNIDKQVLKNLRATGLAHIRSVSGMHLSLVAAIFFFSSRLLLNLFEEVALNIHCKKIAAFIALLGSFAYLLISGMEVAAIRAFIMSSMIIIAVIIDRTSSPMRAIALAAIAILLATPENIIHPSLQMSFAAVLALIACFEIFSKLKFDFNEFNLVQKILFYFLSVSFASLIAGLATALFSLYHFNQSSNYSILANLLAVPITSFWLMPLVVLTFLLYPFHLEFLSLKLMKYGIILIFKIAHYIANLPYSVTAFAKITDLNLLIIVFGMLWFCLWQTKVRFVGGIIILLGIALQSLVVKADIFIDWQKKIVAVLDQQDRLIFLTKPLGKFKKQLLMNQLGAVSSWRYSQIKSDQLKCNEQKCYLHKNNYQVKINLKAIEVEILKYNILQRVVTGNSKTSVIYIK